MRLVIAECSATYTGRLGAHLPRATRLLIVKADGSVLAHSDGGSYKPLNWMSPPCTLKVTKPEPAGAQGQGQHGEGEAGQPAGDQQVMEIWRVAHQKSDDVLTIEIYRIDHDVTFHLGPDPGVVREMTEAHLQELLAEQITLLGEGHTLVRREYMTAIGPVDILARSPHSGHVAVEIKRRGEIDGVEQLTRYVELLNRDPLLAPVKGVFAAQEMKPQARVLAHDRGIDTMILDYEAMKGVDTTESRLF